MKYLSLLLLLCSLLAYGDSEYGRYYDIEGNALNHSDNETLYKLNQQQRRGVDGRGLNGAVGVGGEVVFTYGTTQASVVCAVLELCDIQLQEGENINSISIGDSTRWHVSTAYTGQENNLTTHVLLKPLDNGLKTSLFIATDRRHYHLGLKSTIDHYMPVVRFNYPDDSLSSLNKGFKPKNKATDKAIEKKESAYKLDFNYRLKGDDAIMPKRVYHNGKQTFIDLDMHKLKHRMPALLIVSARGGLFSSDALAVANYRLVGDSYVVDGIVSHAELLLGDSQSGESLVVNIDYED